MENTLKQKLAAGAQPAPPGEPSPQGDSGNRDPHNVQPTGR